VCVSASADPVAVSTFLANEAGYAQQKKYLPTQH
jgi:hypothetical protein